MSIFLETVTKNLNRDSEAKKDDSDSSDSGSEKEAKTNQMTFNINTIYEFDIENKKVLQVLPLVEVLDWQ
mgnify:CR=1 FL=1